MQYRVYNRKTLKYVDGGYISSYNIDDDYIVNNNSTISVVKKNNALDLSVKTHTEQVGEDYDYFNDGFYVEKTYTFVAENTSVPIIRNVTILSDGERGKVVGYNGNQYTIRFLSHASYENVTLNVEIEFESENINSLSKIVVGDIVALIEDSGAFHKGVITSIDSTARTISYKSDKELFNDNILNPLRDADAFLDEDETTNIAGKFGVEAVIAILRTYFSDKSAGVDPLQALPIVFEANGDVLDDEGNSKMLWTWADDSINLVDWLTELFEKYNLTLTWSIDFNIAEELLTKRNPTYVVTLSAITNSGNVIKDNVDMQTITYTTKELPEATVCYVIDNETKDLLEATTQKNLIQGYGIKKNKMLTTNNSLADSDITNTTNYIPIEKNKQYVLSLTNREDTDGRFVFAYDEDKKAIGRFALFHDGYSRGEINLSAQNIYNYCNSVSEYTNWEKEKTVEDIAYIRISYPNTAYNVQFEEGEYATEYEEYSNAVYYLYETENKEYAITTDKNNTKRVLPVKTVVATFSTNSESSANTTPEDVAREKLIPSKYNQAIEIRINEDSKMFDFTNASFGDLYKIINERGTIDSVYTGKKSSSNERWVTLYFGLGRQNYTDIIQLRLRKQRYTEVYNQ